MGLALVWSEELVRGRSGRPLNCDLLMAAEPRRQSVVRVVTVDFFYRRAPAYSAELKPGNLVRVVASAGYSAPRRPRPLGRGVLNKHHLFRSIRGGSVCTRALTDPAALGAASLLVLARCSLLFAALLPLSSRVGRTPEGWPSVARLEREPACPKAASCAHSPRDPRLRATRPSSRAGTSLPKGRPLAAHTRLGVHCCRLTQW